MLEIGSIKIDNIYYLCQSLPSARFSRLSSKVSRDTDSVENNVESWGTQAMFWLSDYLFLLWRAWLNCHHRLSQVETLEMGC
jgi:hypothetical protein